MSHLKSIVPIVSAPLFAMILAACSLPSLGPAGRHEILVSLPPAPASWAGLPDLRLALSWKGPGGRQRSALAPPGAELRIEVDRGRPQAIIALPSSAGRRLRPAGGLYPEALAGADRLALDWLGGYAASLALALEGGGADPWGYDLSRLAAEAFLRCGDPWLLPALEAASALASLEFRIDAFKAPPRRPVALPDPGPWSPESPFGTAPVDSIAQLPPGLWRYLGSEDELLVSVDGEGQAIFLQRGPPSPH